VDQHIEATVRFDDVGDHGAPCICFSDVAGHEGCTVTINLGQLLGGISGAYNDFGASAEKALGNAAANALGAACDKHDAIFEIGFLFHGSNLPIARVSRYIQTDDVQRCL
jgi:hypothetical protein